MNVEYSLGPFCNWFLPSCLDIWSSPDGQRVLCSYGARSMVCLLNVINKKTVKAYDSVTVFSHKSFVSVTRFHKTNRKKPLLFVGSGEGEAAIIDCSTNEITYHKNQFEDLSLPSKKILSAVWSEDNDNPIVYYSLHSVIIRWEVNTDSTDVWKIGENCEKKVAISCMTFTNVGRKKLAVGYMNGDITLLYLENFGMDLGFVLNGCVERTLSGHNDDICSLCFGWTKGQYEEGVLASVSRDGFVKVWDVINNNNIADIKLDAMKAQHKNWFALSFVPNSRSNEKFQILIGSGTGEILSIEVPNKPPDSKIRIHKPMSYMKNSKLSHNTVIFSIAIEPKNMIAISSSLDHQIIVWDLNERKGIDSFYTSTHGVHDISVSPIDPSRVAIAIGDGVHVIKFDEHLKVVNQRRIYFPKTSKSKDSKCFSVVWHPDCENRLAFGISSGDITVIDLNSSQKTPKYLNKSTNFNKIYGLIWGPSLQQNEELALYSVHSNGKLYLHYISSNLRKDFTEYIEEDVKRSEILWKTNYKHLSVGNDSGTVDVFQYQNYKLDLKVRIEAFIRPILSLKWNSIKDEETSNWLAVSSYDGSIKCYSLYNFLRSDLSLDESTVHTITQPNRVLKSHSERVTSMSWCPYDSNQLVSVSYDKTALVWDVSKETPLKVFNGHRGILYCVLWSLNDSDLIFSGGEDNYFHIWRPSKQNPLKSGDEHCSNGDNYWPHLEQQLPIDEEKCVSDVLNDCMDRVVSNQISLQNGFRNGFDAEEDIKRQKVSKNKVKTIKKKTTNKEDKRISLLPLSNSIENSSTKYQKIEDIEALFEKITGTDISEEKNQRILLYGNSDDIKKFVDNELSNHLKQGNKESKDILNLLFDIKPTIEESIQQKETNPFLVSLSVSVSRNHWKESTNLLAKQLVDLDSEVHTYRFYRLEMSAIILLSQNKVKEAIDLLVSNHLFREALIASKAKMNSQFITNHIINEWAEYRKQNNDFEGAAKCLTAIKKFSEAADLLTLKNDQQFDHTISLFRSFYK